MAILKAYVLAVLAVVLVAGPAGSGHAASEDGGLKKLQRITPRPMSDTAFVDAAGGHRSIADFRGKVVLLNFWATWCAPCLKEMPSLNRLQGRLADAGLAVVTLSQDRGKRIETAKAYFAKKGYDHLAFYHDPKSTLAREVEVPGLPTSIVVDREGREVARLAGTAEWDHPAIVAYFRELLEVKP